jgi:anaerobic selenocysteine-containing dehydrogenase
MSTEAGSGVKRRDFLKILGATGATTAVVGCSSEKVGKLIPYVTSPDNTVAGVSQFYATTCKECAAGCGVLAEVRDGRPIKLEGNPEHPGQPWRHLRHGHVGDAGVVQPRSLSAAHAARGARSSR